MQAISRCVLGPLVVSRRSERGRWSRAVYALRRAGPRGPIPIATVGIVAGTRSRRPTRGRVTTESMRLASTVGRVTGSRPCAVVAAPSALPRCIALVSLVRRAVARARVCSCGCETHQRTLHRRSPLAVGVVLVAAPGRRSWRLRRSAPSARVRSRRWTCVWRRRACDRAEEVVPARPTGTPAPALTPRRSCRTLSRCFPGIVLSWTPRSAARIRTGIGTVPISTIVSFDVPCTRFAARRIVASAIRTFGTPIIIAFVAARRGGSIPIPRWSSFGSGSFSTRAGLTGGLPRRRVALRCVALRSAGRRRVGLIAILLLFLLLVPRRGVGRRWRIDGPLGGLSGWLGWLGWQRELLGGRCSCLRGAFTDLGRIRLGTLGCFTLSLSFSSSVGCSVGAPTGLRSARLRGSCSSLRWCGWICSGIGPSFSFLGCWWIAWSVGLKRHGLGAAAVGCCLCSRSATAAGAGLSRCSIGRNGHGACRHIVILAVGEEKLEGLLDLLASLPCGAQHARNSGDQGGGGTSTEEVALDAQIAIVVDEQLEDAVALFGVLARVVDGLGADDLVELFEHQSMRLGIPALL